MQSTPEQTITECLAAVPDGKLLIRHADSAQPVLVAHHLAAGFPDGGKGCIRQLELYPGVELGLQIYSAPKCIHHHDHIHATVMEISYCRAGRIGWVMQDGVALYLGAGDVSLHNMNSCARSELEFPLGYYEGVFLSVDVDKLDDEPPEFLRAAGVSARDIYARFCGGAGSSTLAGNKVLAAVFDGLYTVDAAMLLPFAQLKFQELMMILAQTPAPETPHNQYKAEQIAVVRQVHDLLMSDLRSRYTIEDLSRRFLMNTSTLKDVFKTVYGKPLAAHMKEHRMKRAAVLLRETDLSLAEISAQVGYESQSKLTAAFKAQYGVLPSEYRRLGKK